VAIAKLLFSDSKVLILDEPTKHLDSSTKIEVYNLMNRCTGDGMSILFISSDLKELKGMCDRIMVMQKGKGVEWIKPE
jgi:ABC-type sugar transport system ATPase subunit